MKNLQIWLEVQRKYHLSNVQIQMARELGMNPNKIGKLATHKQQPWKLPLAQFIEKIYFKQFKRKSPLQVVSLTKVAQQEVQERKQNKAQRKLEKQMAGSKDKVGGLNDETQQHFEHHNHSISV